MDKIDIDLSAFNIEIGRIPEINIDEIPELIIDEIPEIDLDPIQEIDLLKLEEMGINDPDVIDLIKRINEL